MIKYSQAADQKELFRKHRARIAEFADRRDGFKEVKIAFLSGVTYQPLDSLIELLLLEKGYNPSFFLGDYNAFKFDSEFSPEFADFDPDFVYIHTSIDIFSHLPEITSNSDQVADCVRACSGQIITAANAVTERTRAQVLINNVELPNYRINGNYEAVAGGGMNRFVQSVNQKLADFSLATPRVVLNDINYLSAKLGLENWRDENAFFAFKQPYTQRAQVEIARSVASLLLTSLGHQKKALVLDLDNTVWGGIIGDDGADKIKIGMDTPKGEAYLRFQRIVRPLLNRGIAFAACSKNDHDMAKTGFEREEMLLKLDDFHVAKINWDPKSVNIDSIRASLNIGLDSIVFVDDSDFERNEIRFALPDVYIPDVGNEPNSYVRALSDEYVFETLAISAEDMNRSESFRSMIKLEEAGGAQDIDAYLASLNMVATTEGVTEANEDRIHQLINKTNQFNLTTTRLNSADVAAYKDTGFLLSASLSDDSTKYGLISVLWGQVVEDNIFDLENWVMSCRVFNRKLEFLMFEEMCDAMRVQGCTSVRARYIKSPKNRPVVDLLPKLGFEKISGDEENCVFLYDLSISDTQRRNELKSIYK